MFYRYYKYTHPRDFTPLVNKHTVEVVNRKRKFLTALLHSIDFSWTLCSYFALTHSLKITWGPKITAISKDIIKNPCAVYMKLKLLQRNTGPTFDTDLRHINLWLYGGDSQCKSAVRKFLFRFTTATVCLSTKGVTSREWVFFSFDKTLVRWQTTSNCIQFLKIARVQRM
jgi:hypothetical protein